MKKNPPSPKGSPYDRRPYYTDKRGVFADACQKCGRLLSRRMRDQGHVCGKGRR
jgi:hypothetical protein